MTRLESSPDDAATSYSAGKPALLFSDNDAAMRQTASLFAAAGVRIAGTGLLGQASDRLAQQVAVGLVWVECAEPPAIPSDALLDQLALLATSGAASVVATAPASLPQEWHRARAAGGGDFVGRAAGAAASTGRRGRSGGRRCGIAARLVIGVAAIPQATGRSRRRRAVVGGDRCSGAAAEQLIF